MELRVGDQGRKELELCPQRKTFTKVLVFWELFPWALRITTCNIHLEIFLCVVILFTPNTISESVISVQPAEWGVELKGRVDVSVQPTEWGMELKSEVDVSVQPTECGMELKGGVIEGGVAGCSPIPLHPIKGGLSSRKRRHC